MKRFTFFRISFFLFIMSVVSLSNGQDVYQEDFDISGDWGGGTAGSYNYKTYINPAGPLNDQFFSDDAIRESTNSVYGYAWRLRNAGTPHLTYECMELVVGFSVYLAHWNPAVSMEVSIDYSVNGGLSYTTLATLDEYWWTDEGLGEKEYKQFLSGSMDISPEPGSWVCLRIMTDGNERLLIDNFQLLYDNGSAGVEDPQDFTAITASESQIDLVFVPNNANDQVVIVYDDEGSFDDPGGEPPAAGQPFAGGTLFYQGVESPQAHVALSPGTTVYYKAWSYDGSNYSQGISAQAETSASNELPNAWVNEIHYDNDGGDVDEFVEIVVENPETFDLNNVFVFLYNGSNGEFYASESVDNFVQGISIDNFTIFTWFYSGIQNGAPEGVALCSGDILIPGQLLSYEGIFLATNGPAQGVYSQDIGVEEPSTSPPGYSLQLAGSGSAYEHFYWTEPSDDTPGMSNNMQDVGSVMVWTGAIDSNWETAGNWENGIPGPASHVIITDNLTNQPVISNAVEVESLLLEEGCMLDIAVTGSLTVSGSFTNFGNLSIHSDASGTGSLIEYNGVNALAEQYLIPNQWHYIACPVSETYSDVFEGMYLMEWDEPTESWNFIEEMGIPLNSGLHGYGVWSGQTSELVFEGSMNTGPFTMNVTNTEGSTSPENDPSGFNLAGNPYPSSLDWDVDDGNGWTRSSANVALSIYYWNGSQYSSYVKDGPNPGPNGGTNIIPPLQGFFVKCLSSEGGAFGVDNGARMHADQVFYKETEDKTEFVRIRMIGNNYSDELILYENENATAGFDQEFDACKLFGSDEAPQIYCISSDNTKLSISSIPDLTGNLTQLIGFNCGAPGIYEWELAEVEGLDGVSIFLEDLYENVITNLNESTVYPFYSSEGQHNDRFLLHLGEGEIPVFQNNNNHDVPLIYADGNKIIVMSTKSITGEIQISDVLGRQIISDCFSDADHLEFGMVHERGWYLVRIRIGGKLHNRKVYISD